MDLYEITLPNVSILMDDNENFGLMFWIQNSGYSIMFEIRIILLFLQLSVS